MTTRQPSNTGKKVTHVLSLDEGLEEYQTISAEVDAELVGLGISPPHRPRIDKNTYFDGRLPSDIKECSTSELVEYMGLMTTYADFINNLAIKYKAAKKNAEEQLKFTRARVRKTKQGTVQQKEDDTICDFRYIDANRNYIKAEELYDRIQAIADAASRDVKFLSRALEGKRISFEQSRRSTNVTRRTF